MMTPATASQVLSAFIYSDVMPAVSGDRAKQEAAADAIVALTQAMGIAGAFSDDFRAMIAALRKPSPPIAEPPRLTDEEAIALLMERVAAFEAGPSEMPQ
jgi:hypothetical protein